MGIDRYFSMSIVLLPYTAIRTARYTSFEILTGIILVLSDEMSCGRNTLGNRGHPKMTPSYGWGCRRTHPEPDMLGTMSRDLDWSQRKMTSPNPQILGDDVQRPTQSQED